MNNRKTWQNYARATASGALNTDVYALQWAHDVRCLRTSHAHRRVGIESSLALGWLNVGSFGVWVNSK
jgi:hypothetical protein